MIIYKIKRNARKELINPKPNPAKGLNNNLNNFKQYFFKQDYLQNSNGNCGKSNFKNLFYYLNKNSLLQHHYKSNTCRCFSK